MNKKADEHWVVKFLGNLLDYGPIIATVITAIVFSILTNIPGNTTGNTQTWVLLILAFIATTQLVDRFRFMRSLDNKVTLLLESQKSTGLHSVEINDEMPNLQERMLKAKKISIAGLVLMRKTLNYESTYKRCLQNGTSIRVLISNPNNMPLLKMVSAAIVEDDDPSYGAERVRGDLNRVCEVFTRLFSEAKTTNKSVGIRFLDIRSSYEIWIFDEGTDQAEAWVELTSYRSYKKPALHLLPNQNKALYEFFCSQYKKMWEGSKPTAELIQGIKQQDSSQL